MQSRRLGVGFYLISTPSSGIVKEGNLRREFKSRANAMTPETIQKHLLNHPFQPFRLCLSDGSAYEVRQPEMVLVMQREVIIAQPKPGERFPKQPVYCDLLHITRIEPMGGGNGTKPRPKTRG